MAVMPQWLGTFNQPRPEVPLPNRPITNYGQAIGDALQGGAQIVQNQQDILQKMLAARVANIRAERDAMMLQKDEERKAAEEKRKADEEKRRLDFLAKVNKGKEVSPTLAKDPSLASRAQPGGLPSAQELAQLELDASTSMPSQRVSGMDSTRLMGEALNRPENAGSMAGGITPYTRDEIPMLALQSGRMTPSEYMASTKDASSTNASYRDIEIPQQSMGAWGRSVEWFNRMRKVDPGVNQIDLMERFVQEQMEDGISKNDARAIQTRASSRINQVYGTGIRNQWDATSKAVDAGEAATRARELGIDIPGVSGVRPGSAWSKEASARIDDIVSKIKQDYGFKEKTESIANAQKIINAQDMAKTTPAALAASITSLARQMAPGVVTDRDFTVLTDYGAPIGVRTWDALVQWLTGDPAAAKVDAVGAISKVLESAAQRASADILNMAYESVRSTGLNVDKNRLWEHIAPTTSRRYLDMGDKPTSEIPEKKPKTSRDFSTLTEADIDTMSAEELKQFLGQP